jgi:hypothetical protein
MIYAIPIMGWLIGFLSFLPSVYLELPFWDCIGLFMIRIGLCMLMPLAMELVTPREVK